MFNTYDELMQAVEERRKDTLTLAIDLGGKYSQEYEDAKTELAQAKGMKLLTDGQGFMNDNVQALEARVASLKPESRSVWVRFERLSLAEWALLVKQQNLTPYDQYERVLPKTFVGVYGQDPEGEGVEPLSTDAELLSTRSEKGILHGGQLTKVLQTFLAWQNSSGEIQIRPTKSGRD